MRTLGGGTFDRSADFQYATFKSAGFYETTFSGNANFQSTTFEYANFSNAQFHNTAHFKGSSFSKLLNLDLVRYKEYADFREATIGRLSFCCKSSRTIAEGHTDFRNSTISEAHFEDLIFEKDVDFSDTTLNAVTFRFVTFSHNAYFTGTRFQGNTTLERVRFKHEANFTDADFKSPANNEEKRFMPSHVTFDKLTISWNQLPNPMAWVVSPSERLKSFRDLENIGKDGNSDEKPKPLQPLSHVLKQLETNFRKSNQVEDANEAFYYRKQAELRESSTKSPVEKILLQLEWLSWGIWTGYGVRIWRVIFLCALVDLFFALLYFVGKPQRKYEEGGQRDFTFKQRFLEFPRKYLTRSPKSWTSNQKLIRFANSVRLSSVILFKFGYRDTTISGKLAGIDYKYIIWTEWLLGFFLLGFLVVTLSNTLPILHKLVSAVF